MTKFSGFLAAIAVVIVAFGFLVSAQTQHASEQAEATYYRVVLNH